MRATTLLLLLTLPSPKPVQPFLLQAAHTNGRRITTCLRDSEGPIEISVTEQMKDYHRLLSNYDLTEESSTKLLTYIKKSLYYHRSKQRRWMVDKNMNIHMNGNDGRIRMKNTKSSSSSAISTEQLTSVLSYLFQTFSHTTANTILAAHPRVIAKSVTHQLTPTHTFLSLLFESRVEEALQRNEGLLLMQGLGFKADNYSSVKTFLEDGLGCTEKEVDKLKQKCPVIFQTPASKISAVAYYLKSLSEDEDGESCNSATSPSCIKNVLLKHPVLFTLDIENNLKLKVELLREKFHITNMKKLVNSSPSILGLGCDNLTEKLGFFQRELDFNSCCGGFNKHPALILLNHENIREKIRYFNNLSSSNTNNHNLASRIFQSAPTVYSLSLESSIIPKVAFLQKVFGNIEKFDMTKFISSDPLVLTLDLEGNLKPTVTFLRENNYLKDDAVPRGRYLMASLNRLLVRHHYYQQEHHHHHLRGCESSATTTLPLHILAVGNDKHFVEYCGTSMKDFQNYRDNDGEKLLFGRQFKLLIEKGILK